MKFMTSLRHSSLISLLIIFTMVFVQTFSSIAYADDTSGQSVSDTFEDGVLTISGSGEIADNAYRERTDINEVIIEEGITSVAEKHYGGNHRNLRYEEEAALLEEYRQRAESGQMLSIKEIEAAYEKQVGHRISNSQIYRVLHRHGWRKIMPRSRHPKKASEEVIEASKNKIQN